MKTWLKILLILLFIGIIAALAGYFFIYNKPHKDYARAKTDHRIAASDLFQAYKERSEESGKFYTGKVIEISGNITTVETNDTIVTVVFVFSQGVFGDEGIRCSMLPGYFEKARQLSPETTCTIKGFCSGYNESDVILENCSIIN